MLAQTSDEIAEKIKVFEFSEKISINMSEKYLYMQNNHISSDLISLSGHQ